jgi:hypothetical protein
VSRRQVGARRTGWCGGSDIYVTRQRDDHGFDEPRKLGCEVNSAADEFSPFPVDERGSGSVLYFSSTRPGLGTGGDPIGVSPMAASETAAGGVPSSDIYVTRRLPQRGGTR